MGLRQTYRKAKFARRLQRALREAKENFRSPKTTIVGVLTAVLSVFALMEPEGIIALMRDVGLGDNAALIASGIVGLLMIFKARDGAELPDDKDDGVEVEAG